MKKQLLIAEVKTQSPFGFKSDKSWMDLFHVAVKYGDIISIHTDARWGGSPHLIDCARQFTDKPILAKGIHRTDEEAQEMLKRGADFVLIVGRIANIPFEKCLIEPTCVSEIDYLNTLPSHIRAHIKIVWNSRNLLTGEPKYVKFEDIREKWEDVEGQPASEW